jgi:hypothetical protein
MISWKQRKLPYVQGRPPAAAGLAVLCMCHACSTRSQLFCHIEYGQCTLQFQQISVWVFTQWLNRPGRGMEGAAACCLGGATPPSLCFDSMTSHMAFL